MTQKKKPIRESIFGMYSINGRLLSVRYISILYLVQKQLIITQLLANYIIIILDTIKIFIICVYRTAFRANGIILQFFYGIFSRST